MLYDQGDILPQLEVTTAERVQPGEIYWGCARDPQALREGWHLEPEPTVITDGARFVQVEGEGYARVMLGQIQFLDRAHPVLVQRYMDGSR